MKHLFSKFLVAFLLTSAVVLSWSEYFFILKLVSSWLTQENNPLNQNIRNTKAADFQSLSTFFSCLLTIFQKTIVPKSHFHVTNTVKISNSKQIVNGTIR